MQCFLAKSTKQDFASALAAINVVACRKEIYSLKGEIYSVLDGILQQEPYYRSTGQTSRCPQLALELHDDVAYTPSHRPALFAPRRKRVGRAMVEAPLQPKKRAALRGIVWAAS
jgi:hypothetical protein